MKKTHRRWYSHRKEEWTYHARRSQRRRVLSCAKTAQAEVVGFFFVLFLGFQKKREKKEEGKKEGDCVTVFVALVFAPSASVFPPKALTTIYHSLFCSKRRRRRRMIPNALHKPFYTVRCSFVLSLCLSSTLVVAIFKSIQTRAFVLLVLSLTSSSV